MGKDSLRRGRGGLAALAASAKEVDEGFAGQATCALALISGAHGGDEGIRPLRQGRVGKQGLGQQREVTKGEDEPQPPGGQRLHKGPARGQGGGRFAFAPDPLRPGGGACALQVGLVAESGERRQGVQG